MRVLLANPYVLREDGHEMRFMHLYPPLGTLYVASSLIDAGHEVRVLDATFEPSAEALEPLLASWRPAVVGVYTTFLSKANALAMGDAARSRGMLAIAGGPDANVEPEAYLAHFDAVVMGEGERTMREVVAAVAEGREWRGVAGLAVLREGVVVRTAARPRIQDLDAMPLPARHLVDMARYERAWRSRHGYFSTSITASRGCPYACNFCSRPIFGSLYRARSVAGVVAELLAIEGAFHPDRVWFTDDILAIDRDWIVALCDAIRGAGLDMEYHALCRADLMDDEVLAAMRAAGFRQVYYGVESGSQCVLDAMNKRTTVEGLRRASKATRRAGIDQHWFIMLGYPGETRRDVEATIALLLEMAPDSFSTTVAYPIKGTRLYDQVERDLTASAWRQSVDVRLMFKNRYPRLFYRWTILRMRTSMMLRRRVAGPGSVVMRLYDRACRAVSVLLAGERGELGGP